MDNKATHSAETSTPRRTYALVFLVLVIITAVEVGLASTALSRGLLTTMFLSLSFAKAALVAGFYMHLNHDNRLYTYLLVLPAILLMVFLTLLILS